jgi:hypothetical protein
MPSSFYDKYFGKGRTVRIEDARAKLLTPAVGIQDYGGDAEKYQAAVLEQYKIYVEMADRISARRALTNTFFLTLNTGVFTVIGFFWNDRPTGPSSLLAFPAAILVGQCLAWFWILRSYRQLNSGKYAVIGALEELLPTSPYWRAEWSVLGTGEDKAKYWPLTHLEQWVPLMFGLAYAGGFVAALVVS